VEVGGGLDRIVNMIHFVNVVHTFVPHARRREDKTEALLDVAMRVLVAEGIEGLTLQRVARELGLVTTAIYRYFPSKDALVAALQRRAVSTMHAHFTELQRAAEHGTRSPLVPLVAIARAYIALPKTHPEVFRLIAVLLGDPRQLVGDEEALRTLPLVAAFLGDVETLFERAQGAGAIRKDNARVQTLILWAALHGVTQLEKMRRLARGVPAMTALGDETISTVLHGFGAEPSALNHALKRRPS
jgi:AcrR family transcriptional regulator